MKSVRRLCKPPFGFNWLQCFALLFLILFVAWMLAKFSLAHILWRVEASPGLAAWVQAVFSVVAIVAAGLLPYHFKKMDEMSAKRERERAAIYIYISLRDEILAYKFFLVSYVEKYRKLGIQIYGFEDGIAVGDLAKIFADSFLVPDVDGSQLRELDFLSENGASAIASAISNGKTMKMFLDRLVKYSDHAKIENLTSLLDEFNERADITIERLQTFIHILDAKCEAMGIEVD